MSTTDKHTRQFAIFYLACFVAYFAWSSFYGLTFTQIKPLFFYNQPDLTGNILLLTNIHLKLIQEPNVQKLFDLVYFFLPIITTILVYRQYRFQSIAAALLIVFNIIYAFCFSIMSFISIKVMLAFMIVPVVFLFKKPKNFYLAIDAVRILFIIFFFSTALWKIRAGGVFNGDQMSGILLNQHNYLFLNNHPGAFKSFISFLIEHPRLSYCLYFAAFAAEFFFSVGLFTRKFDKLLILLFLLFAIMNYMLMRINYFAWLPFVGCLYFSKYSGLNALRKPALFVNEKHHERDGE